MPFSQGTVKNVIRRVSRRDLRKSALRQRFRAWSTSKVCKILRHPPSGVKSDCGVIGRAVIRVQLHPNQTHMIKPSKALLLSIVGVFLGAGASAYAGETYTPKEAPPPVVAPPPSVYRDNEWQVDIFGVYAFSESTNERIFGDHAFGGGLGVNYFFARYFGVGLEGQYLDTREDGLGTAALNVFYRYPVGNWAPYVYIGGGVIFNANDISKDEFADEFDEDDRDSNDVLVEGHAGLGIEYRFAPNIGIFSDGRWTIVEDAKNNFPEVRAGIRLAF